MRFLDGYNANVLAGSAQPEGKLPIALTRQAA